MNKTTQKYFINLFKRKNRILALYTFVVFMAYPFLLITDVMAGDAVGIENITLTIFILCLVCLGALAIVLPLFTFKFCLVKKNVDTYFSLPINRNHLFIAHFWAPILGAILPILASYLIGGLFLIPRNGLDIYFGLLILLILAFILFIVIYSMNTFIILKCNNIIDATLISCAIGIVPLMLYSASYTFLSSQILNGMLDNFVSKFPQLIIDLLSPYRGFFLIGEVIKLRSRNINIDFGNFDYVLFIYYIVIGILLFIQAKKSFKGKKGEDAEQLTTHYLTYPLLTNVALVSLILNFNFTDYDITTSILIMIVLFVIYMIIHGIAQRSFKFNMKMIIKFVVLFVVINGFNFISKETEFFGFNRKVLDYTQYEKVNLDLYVYDYSSEITVLYHLEMDSKEQLSQDELEVFKMIANIQKEKSIAYKNDDYDTLYPNNLNSYYDLQIFYDYEDDSIPVDHYAKNKNDEYVSYSLSKLNANELIEILVRIDHTNIKEVE